MEHNMAGLNGKIFEMVKKDMAGLVVIEYIVKGSQTAVYSLFLGQKGLRTGSWGQ